MIQIASSILSATSAKIEKAVEMADSPIFYGKNSQDTILGRKILPRKFG